MVSRILLGTYRTTGDMFWFCMEVCVDLIAFCLLIRRPRQRETGVTCANDGGPKGKRKRLNSITLFAYPRSYMIFTALMWNMYSVAMILCCALSCFGAVFRPFEYGFIRLFALPRLTKPPDLVSEGGKIHCSNVYDYDTKYDYFIKHQKYLGKVLRAHHLNTSLCHKHLRNTRKFRHMWETLVDRCSKANTIADESHFNCSNNITERCDCSNDIPLSEFSTAKLTPPPAMDEPIVMLRHDRAGLDRLKNYAWMAGASVDLDSGSASVLRNALDSSIYLASGLTAVIFDTGASMSISNNKADFPYGIEPCNVDLQGIGSGLHVKGKGKVRWKFQKVGGGFVTVENMAYYEPAVKFKLFSPQSYLMQAKSEGKFIMSKNGIFFELNKNDCVHITLNAANLPVALATHTADVVTENAALITCATDARNVNCRRTPRDCFNGTIV